MHLSAQNSDAQQLRAQTGRLHTTPLGEARIKRNLGLLADDAVGWCRQLVLSPDAIISRQGKNWYVQLEDVRLTINVSAYSIITAHRIKAENGANIPSAHPEEL